MSLTSHKRSMTSLVFLATDRYVHVGFSPEYFDKSASYSCRDEGIPSSLELRLNPQLIHALTDAAEVVAEHLAQQFVELRHVAFASSVLSYCLSGLNMRRASGFLP